MLVTVFDARPDRFVARQDCEGPALLALRRRRPFRWLNQLAVLATRCDVNDANLVIVRDQHALPLFCKLNRADASKSGQFALPQELHLSSVPKLHESEQKRV